MSLILRVVVFMAFVHSRLSFTLQNKKMSFGSSNVDCLQMMSDSNNPFAARNIVIPESKLAFSYARCSGPGGQNVNKLNTKAEIRFHVFNADWLPVEVKQRLSQQQANKINNDGELLVTSQEHRTQANNREDCIEKIKVMVAQAYIIPKERNMYEGISKGAKIENKVVKRARGAVKSARRSNNIRGGDDDY